MAEQGNQIAQESESTGTGDINLLSKKRSRDFSSEWANGGTDIFYYFLRNTDISLEEYEVGTGHLVDSSTLSRDTVIESSNSNNLVDLSSGKKEVVNDIPASRQNNHNYISNISSDDHHAKYTDSDAISAINNDSDHSLTADHSDVSSSGIWKKDGELNSSLQKQVTYNMSASWDKVKVFGKVYVDSSTGNNRGFDISLRINNDSERNYHGVYIGRGDTLEDNAFRLVSGDDAENVQGPVHYIMDGRWNQESLGSEYWTMNNLQPHSTYAGTDNERLWVSYRGSVNNGSPLTQFTFLENRNNHDIKVNIEVFGRELP